MHARHTRVILSYFRQALYMDLVRRVDQEPSAHAEKGFVTTEGDEVVPARRTIYELTSQGETEEEAWSRLSSAQLSSALQGVQGHPSQTL